MYKAGFKPTTFTSPNRFIWMKLAAYAEGVLQQVTYHFIAEILPSVKLSNNLTN